MNRLPSAPPERSISRTGIEAFRRESFLYLATLRTVQPQRGFRRLWRHVRQPCITLAHPFGITRPRLLKRELYAQP